MRITSIGAVLASAAGLAMAHVGRTVSGAAQGGGRRIVAGTKRARQMMSTQTHGVRSRYTPHIGAKEQERAKRCYMSIYHGGWDGALRSSPTLCQSARRTVEA